jgi:prepilin-type N-terminal cleavage/methylation domain-containing protein
MSHATKKRSRKQAFSLVELLISLAIMGLVAVFTVPAVFQTSSSGQSAKYTSMAADTAFMIMNAYERYRAESTTVAMSTTAGALTSYMNYVAVDTSTPIDDWQGSGTWGCTSSVRCLVLHNGGRLAYWATTYPFSSKPGTTSETYALLFQFDPDGRVTTGTTNGPGKALPIVLYYDGKVGTEGTARANSYYSGTPSYDPPWFTGF